MALLFRVVGHRVVPSDETVLIGPFRKILERDKSKEKGTALKELAYVEFMCSEGKTNPYRQIPVTVRSQEVVRDLFGSDSTWKPDRLVKEAMDRYIFFLREASATYSYYLAAKRAAESVQSFFLNVDLSKMNPKTGLPIYKPKDITSALIETDKVITNLNALARKVSEEQFEEVRTRSQKRISPFANPEGM